MPYISIQDPWGTGYHISTMREDTLKAWFDEILPRVNAHLGEDGIPPAVISVRPMWSDSLGIDADWSTDSRVIGQRHKFRAKSGSEGIAELRALRRRLGEDGESIITVRPSLMSGFDSAAFDRWLTTDPENQPEYLEQELCSTCGLPYDRDSLGCEEHSEWRAESGIYDEIDCTHEYVSWHGSRGECQDCGATVDPAFGPEAYKSHREDCVCWDCKAARENDENGPAYGKD